MANKLDLAKIYEDARDKGMSHEQAVAFVEGRKRTAEQAAKATNPEAYKRDRADLSGAGSAAETFADSATLGLSGLVDDAATAAFSGNRFSDLRGARKLEKQAFSEQNPKTALALELAGAAATPGFGVAKLAANGTKLAKIGAMAGEAALQSGASSLIGNTDDFTTDALGRAIVQGGRDALIGGVTAPVVGKVIGKVAEKGWELGGRIGSASTPAIRAVLNALEQYGAPESVIKAARNKLDVLAKRGLGNEAALADVLGKRGTTGQRLLRTEANISPNADATAKAFARNRDARVGDRAEEALSSAFGAPAQGTRQGIEQLVAERSANAEPLYNQAMQEGADFVTKTPELSEKVVDFFTDPDVRQIVGGLKKMAQFREMPPESPQMLDAVYKVLSDREGTLRASQLTNAKNLGRFEGDALRSLKQKALSATDDMMPSYRDAVQQFAGDSQLKGAYEQGLQLFTKPAGELKSAMATMTDGERETFRHGLLDAMVETKIDARAGNPDLGGAAKKAASVGSAGIDTRAAQKRLQEVLSPEEYKTLLGRAKAEGLFASTSNAVQGNSTTAKQLSDMGVFGNLAGDAIAAVSGSPMGAAGLVRRAGNNVLNVVTAGGRKRGADAVADLLTQKGSRAQDAIGMLIAELERRQGANAIGQRVGGRGITATARLVGAPDNR